MNLDIFTHALSHSGKILSYVFIITVQVVENCSPSQAMFLRKPITQAERGTVGGGWGDKTMRDASTYEVLRKYFQKNWLLTKSNLQVNSINKKILVSINIIEFPGLPKVLLTTMIIFDFTTWHFYSFHY